MTTHSLGYRILGSCQEERRLVDHARAFFGYASCDTRAVVDREGYLSAFVFGEDFRELLQSTGSCRGFAGACWSAWVWFDIDRKDDLGAALRDARRLAHWLIDRYGLDDDGVLVFFSGSKGFHIGLPTALWEPEPSALFNRTCLRLAQRIAEVVGIVIDTGVYDKVRAFRAPNSRHPKTGLHKRYLSFDELQGLSVAAIRQRAEKSEPFDLPTAPQPSAQARTDWSEAADSIRQESEAKAIVNANGRPRLTRQTLHFIREGAREGDRHRLLYSASRNLAEFGCPPALAHALLEESALDSGLLPKDVHRQIECGLKDQSPITVEQSPTSSPMTNAADLQKQLVAQWLSPTSTPPVDPIPDNVGDAWEHPLDRLGFVDPSKLDFPYGATDGPYSKQGGRR